MSECTHDDVNLYELHTLEEDADGDMVPVDKQTVTCADCGAAE